MLVCGGVQGESIMDDLHVLALSTLAWTTLRLPTVARSPPGASSATSGVNNSGVNNAVGGQARDATTASSSELTRYAHAVATIGSRDGGHVAMVYGGYAASTLKFDHDSSGGFTSNLPIFVHHSTPTAAALVADVEAMAAANAPAAGPSAAAPPPLPSSRPRSAMRSRAGDGAPPPLQRAPSMLRGVGGAAEPFELTAEMKERFDRLREAHDEVASAEGAMRMKLAELQRQCADAREVGSMHMHMRMREAGSVAHHRAHRRAPSRVARTVAWAPSLIARLVHPRALPSPSQRRPASPREAHRCTCTWCIWTCTPPR